MQKLLCVFAHPDDETFGPGGSIALWASQGVEIHIICATKGEAGNNASEEETGTVRERELRGACDSLGVKNVEFMGYTDGEIGNKDLAGLEKLIVEKMSQFQPDAVLTFDFNGVTGHLDHIALASATRQAFKKSPYGRELYSFTLPLEYTKTVGEYFVYFPPGRPAAEIDFCLDVSSVYSTRVAAMNKHVSQLGDFAEVEKEASLLDHKEYFWVDRK